MMLMKGDTKVIRILMNRINVLPYKGGCIYSIDFSFASVFYKVKKQYSSLSNDYVSIPRKESIHHLTRGLAISLIVEFSTPRTVQK